MTSVPRVLYVGMDAVGAPGNTGVTTGVCFSNWPSDKMQQLVFRGCGFSKYQQIVLPPDSSLMAAAIRVKNRKGGPKSVRPSYNMSTHPDSSQLSFRSKAEINSRVLLDLAPVRIGPPVMDRIADFGPQVIHSLLSSVTLMRIALLLSRTLKAPIVPHFMDDWPTTLYRGEKRMGIARNQVNRLLGKVLQRAPLGLVIGEAMKSEYERRYGKEWAVVGNAVDLSQYERAPHHGRRGDFVVRYIGNLGLERDTELVNVLEGIDLVNSGIAGRPTVRLEVFAAEADRAKAEALVARSPYAHYGGPLNASDVPETLCSADALLFVESAAPRVLDFTRLSVSSRVPEYIASRRPVIIIGPGDQGSIAVLRSCAGNRHVKAASDGQAIRRALEAVLEQAQGGVSEIPPHLLELIDLHAVSRRFRMAMSEAADSIHDQG